MECWCWTKERLLHTNHLAGECDQSVRFLKKKNIHKIRETIGVKGGREGPVAVGLEMAPKNLSGNRNLCWTRVYRQQQQE